MPVHIPTIAPAEITMHEKLQAARRELAMRKSAYPKWVENPKYRLTPDKAAREIAAMAAIVADYEKIVEGRLLV